jgi:hypothetical protein
MRSRCSNQANKAIVLIPKTKAAPISSCFLNFVSFNVGPSAMTNYCCQHRAFNKVPQMVRMMQTDSGKAVANSG